MMPGMAEIELGRQRAVRDKNRIESRSLNAEADGGYPPFAGLKKVYEDKDNGNKRTI